MGKKTTRITKKINVIINNPKEGKESTWGKIKSILPALTFLLALLTFGFFIYDRYYKENKIKTLKTEILSTIDEIEKDIHTNAIINTPDSSHIRDYRQKVASICALWISLEGDNLFSDLKSLSYEKKKKVAEDYLVRWKTHQLTKIDVFYSLIKLNTESNRLGMDYSKLLSMQEQEKKNQKARAKYFATIKQHLLSHNGDGIMKELDKLRNDIECLTFDKEYFIFVKEANKLVNSTLLSQ